MTQQWQADSFNDLQRPHMARGDFMFHGKAVVIDPRLPKSHVGDWIHPVMPHRHIIWVMEKIFRRKVWPICFASSGKIEEELVFESQGKLFMSPTAWEALKQLAKAGR